MYIYIYIHIYTYIFTYRDYIPLMCVGASKKLMAHECILAYMSFTSYMCAQNINTWNYVFSRH